MSQVQRIFLAEVDGAFREVLRKVLESAGYQVESVLEEVDWIEGVTRSLPDALVLGERFHGPGSIDLCRSLKFRPETAMIPILMLADAGDEPCRGREGGIWVVPDACLTKPFADLELLDRLRHVLARKELLSAQKTRAQLRMQIRSDNTDREARNELLNQLLSFAPLSSEEAEIVLYAVSEMIENALEWGNRRQQHLLVTIEYQVTDAMMNFVIQDEGPGFDLSALPHAAATEDFVTHLSVREGLGLREGGFGILSCKNMVDRVEYNETGNQVTLIKYLRQGAG